MRKHLRSLLPVPIVLIIFKCSIFTRSVLLLGSLISPSLSPTLLLASLSSSDMITQGGVNTRRAHSWLRGPGRVQTINSGHYTTHRIIVVSSESGWRGWHHNFLVSAKVRNKIWKNTKGKLKVFVWIDLSWKTSEIMAWITLLAPDKTKWWRVILRDQNIITTNLRIEVLYFHWILISDLIINYTFIFMQRKFCCFKSVEHFPPLQCLNIPLLWATTI